MKMFRGTVFFIIIFLLPTSESAIKEDFTFSRTVNEHFRPSNRCPSHWMSKRFENNQDCKSYYICSRGWLMKVQCPDGKVYNSETTFCDYTRNIDCKGRSILITRQEFPCTTGIYTDQTSCNKYINCADGTPYARYCPDGLRFDSTNRICNIPSKVFCGNRKIEDSRVTTRTPKGGIGGNFKCPSKQGVYPFDGDCKKFWLCRDFDFISLMCPTGLTFDRSIRHCIVNGVC